jgi:hypothetical protein
MFKYLLLFLCLSLSVYAQPNTITYQGVLTDNAGAIVADANYNLVFSLYTTSDGSGGAAWSETHTNTPVSKGMFSVELGGTTTFASASVDFSNQYYLKITVNGTDLTPLIKFNAAGYSMNSAKATSASTATNISGGSQGTIPYQTASGATTMLAKGAAGQVLTMNAGATAPEWTNTGDGGATVTYAIKTSDQSTSNNTVLVDAADLVVNWGANPGLYMVEGWIYFDEVEPSFIKYKFTTVGSGSPNSGVYLESGMPATDFSSLREASASFQGGIPFYIILDVPATVTGLKFQFSQLVSGAYATTIKKGSFMRCIKVN